MRYTVGQLTVGQILDQSLRLFMNRPGLFLGITGIVYVPVLVIHAVASRLLVYQPEPGATQEEVLAGTMETVNTAVIISGVFMAVLLILAGPLLSAAVTYAVKKEYMDEHATVGESIKKALSKLWPVVYTGFFSGIFILGGLVLCVVPGIYLMFRYYLAQQVVVLEDRAGFDAMNRSGALMKGSYGIAFVLGFMAWVMSFMAGMLAAVVPVPLVSDFISIVVSAAVVTVWTVAAVVLYFHCRARNENYDLQLLAESVADDSDGQPMPPPLPSAE